MITVVCYLWFDPNGKCNHVHVYGPEDVRLLKSMVDRHLSIPHEFVCITDQPESFHDSDIRAVELDWSKHVPGTRFNKLMAFHPQAEKLIGRRILQLDLDCVIVKDIAPLVLNRHHLVLWRNPNCLLWKHPTYPNTRRARYNSSIMLLTAGVRPDLWTAFDPERHPKKLRKKSAGTDQAWISANVSLKEAHWTRDDGIYGVARSSDRVPGVGEDLPDNARIVFFSGQRSPACPELQDKHPWIRQHRF